MAKKIWIVGAGPGCRDNLTEAALSALHAAQLLIGSRRLLSEFWDFPCRKAASVAPQEIARLIRESGADRICVLFSGDVGFYSGAAKLYPLLSRYQVETVCGIGSLQYFCAKLHIPWEDVHPASAHGRSLNVAAHAAAYEKTFFLTGGQTSPETICEILNGCGMGEARVTVGSRLSYPDERIVAGSAAELSGKTFDPLSSVLVERAGKSRWDYRTGGISDGLFLRGEVPMTKAEVRAAAVAALRLRGDDVVYDVGAGTGSVSVEMSIFASRGCVYAVEKDEKALKLIAKNKRVFGAGNLEIVPGTAPAVLTDLPAPDAAFIGGSGGRLQEIVTLIARKNPRARVCMTAVTMETLEKGVWILEALGFRDVQASQIAVTRLKKAGSVHMMDAQNPVFVISGQGAGE
mgnify:FL=1